MSPVFINYLGLDNVRNKEAKLTYLTFVWDIHWFVCGYYYDFLRIYTHS